ncbi:VOC family protein [Metabacillus fastidiosus]|uniref:VOC family protein n=1 Tax=Metabacillus fastidiosus TaxID=1458 RepID=UPI003D26EF86
MLKQSNYEMEGENCKKTAGIHHITAMVNDAQRNIDFYAGVLGLRLIKKTVNFDRPEVYYLYFGNESGQPGTVHHIAWRAKDEQDLLRWRSLLQGKEYYPTEIRDRNYFKAVYFHEEGGILFEIATDPPGFSVDEPVAELGNKLMLPLWLESKRKELEETLPTVEVRVLEEDK